jgi:hypothetical protein
MVSTMTLTANGCRRAGRVSPRKRGANSPADRAWAGIGKRCNILASCSGGEDGLWYRNGAEVKVAPN